jgi:phosphoglycolate phosphatase-like HAD superfamily hydrolase
MVAAVLRGATLKAKETWMVGDSAEDRRAAEVNGLRFFAAAWGYGTWAPAPDTLNRPRALLDAVDAAC